MKRLLLAVVLIVGVAQAALAQTNPAFTTTTTAAVSSTATVIPLTAVTSAVSPTTTLTLRAGDGIYADGEYMTVASTYSSGVNVPVVRGQLGTTAKAHASGITVILGPVGLFSTTDPGAGSSACPSQPAVYLAQVNVVSGNVWLCRYISGSRIWWATNSRGITYNSLTVR